MDRHDAARLEHIRRWVRPDWERWLRPDWERYVQPAHRDAMRREIAERKAAFGTWRCARERLRDKEIERERKQYELEWEMEVAALKADWERLKVELLSQKAGFNPDQPRVPAGNPDGGQWTSDGRDETPGEESNVRLAASEGLPIGPRAYAKLIHQVVKRAIEAYRSENLLYGLFDQKRGSVSVTTIDGKDIFGTNRGSRLWNQSDERDWLGLRDRLTEKYPELRQENEGELPLNALTHSETNAIARAARGYGGSLAGRHIEVLTDKPMCTSCPIVLPYVTREFGSPTVTFTYVGPKGLGKSRTIENGEWKSEEQQ